VGLVAMTCGLYGATLELSISDFGEPSFEITWKHVVLLTRYLEVI